MLIFSGSRFLKCSMAVLLSLRVCRSFNLKVLVLSLLALHVSANMYSSFYTEAISETYAEGGALHGYVAETFSVLTLLECQLNCVRLLRKCKSFNYKKRRNDSLNICEISTTSKDLANVEDFLKDDESIYGEVIKIAKNDIPQEVPTTNSYADGPWTLVARFSNKDLKHWMGDQGTWWYDKVEPYGKPLDPGDNADMISEAFWLMSGTEFKITRSDDSTHTALLTTTGNCLGGKTFRFKMASFGSFRGTTSWASSRCRGSCSVSYGGSYTTTAGFGQSKCNGDMQSKNSIGFWCHYGGGDGSALMIGGGGSNCARADHGIGVTEDNSARFYTTTIEYDFGDDANGTPPKRYSLNLWIRQEA